MVGVLVNAVSSSSGLDEKGEGCSGMERVVSSMSLENGTVLLVVSESIVQRKLGDDGSGKGWIFAHKLDFVI